MPKSTSTGASELPAKINHREPTNSSSFVFQATSSFYPHLKTRVELQLGFYLALYDKNLHQHLSFHLPKLNVNSCRGSNFGYQEDPWISHLLRLLSSFQNSCIILITLTKAGFTTIHFLITHILD